MKRQISTTDKLRAQSLNRTGLEHYERWELESAITLFQEATRLNDEEADYHLNLARAQVRMGDYEQMLQALGDYLRTETDKSLASTSPSVQPEFSKPTNMHSSTSGSATGTASFESM